MSYAGVDYDDSYYLARAREENTKLRLQVADLEAKVLKLTPKPREPRGLGAVVKDRDKVTWIRVDPTGDTPWTCPGGGLFPKGGIWKSYANIDAVEVLSDGVIP